MYSNDNKNGFSILDLIVKIIFAGLFIFILVWLFNKKVPNMKPFYSNVFRENIRYMQEAGESYFTDEKMPTEVGQEIKISLGEMIEKKLIIPFINEPLPQEGSIIVLFSKCKLNFFTISSTNFSSVKNCPIFFLDLYSLLDLFAFIGFSFFNNNYILKNMI